MEGQVYKWSAEDFNYVGLITSIEAGRITMVTEEIGEISFMEDDGELTPSGKKIALGHQDLSKRPTNKKPIGAQQPKKLSAKQQQAVDVIKAYVDEHDALPTRPIGMQLLKDQLGFGDGTASTYFATAKRELS